MLMRHLTCEQAWHPDIPTELPGHLKRVNWKLTEGHNAASLRGTHLPGIVLTQHSL